MPRQPRKAPETSAADQPWTIRPASARANKDWQRAKAAEPELMAGLRERLRLRPLDRSDNPNRTHQLKGQLAEKWVGDTKLPQWQHELTGAGRVFYCPDRTTRTVWITLVALAHPRVTE